jgi:hypothetical protein
MIPVPWWGRQPRCQDYLTPRPPSQGGKGEKRPARRVYPARHSYYIARCVGAAGWPPASARGLYVCHRCDPRQGRRGHATTPALVRLLRALGAHPTAVPAWRANLVGGAGDRRSPLRSGATDKCMLARHSRRADIAPHPLFGRRDEGVRSYNARAGRGPGSRRAEFNSPKEGLTRTQDSGITVTVGGHGSALWSYLHLSTHVADRFLCP